MNLNNIQEKTLDYFKGNKLLADIFINKYLLFDSKTSTYKEETPNETFERISKELYRIEQDYPHPLSYDSIYELIKDFKYVIPGGSIIYGIGNNYSYSSLGNCFVIGTQVDSYGGIFRNDEEIAQLMKRRAGVGLDISFLRPAQAVVSNSAKYSTGAVSFMERFSNTTREVAQDGRRGALMLTLDIRHPDVDSFISIKGDLKKVTGANISIKLSKDFMNKVSNNDSYYQVFPINEDIDDIFNADNRNDYNILYKGRKEGTYYKKVKANEIWNKIIHHAWKTGEPGLLFWDNIIKNSPADIYSDEGFNSLSTNPCGEIPLCALDSCRLMSINLYSFVVNPFTDTAWFNWERFKEVVEKAQRLMDDIIDLENEKIDRIIEKILVEYNETSEVEFNLWKGIKDKLLKGRRTGLSGIGIADTLAALGVSYNSQEGIVMSEKIYKELAISSYKESIILASQRGCFPIFNYNKEKDHIFISKILNELTDEYKELYKVCGRRNIANLTIPPSGTIANLAQISSGIEPVYQIYYTRRRKVNPNDSTVKVDYIDDLGDSWEEYKIFHPKFVEWYKIHHPDKIDLQKIPVEYLHLIIKESPYFRQTANDVTPINRIKMQSFIQKWVDHSISSTLNLPKDTTEQIISDIYFSAFDYELKGVTIYRDGSREGVLITDNKIKQVEKFEPRASAKRPKQLPCNIHRLTALKEKWIVLIGILDNNPYEIFALKEPDEITLPRDIKEGSVVKIKRGVYKLVTKNGKETDRIMNIMDYMPEDDKADTRKYSLMLRHRVHPKFIVETIQKFSKNITSFDNAISRVLKMYVKDGEVNTGEDCPICNSKLLYRSGCAECIQCGWSKCA